MGKKSSFLLLALLFILLVPSLHARDLPEPIEAVDPLAGIDENSPAILPTSFLMLRYENYTFRSSDTDTFQIGAVGAVGLFNIGGFAAGKIFYATHLLAGPMLPGDAATSTAHWWMNSTQFQYGVSAGLAVQDFHVFCEYSRASDHPLRPELTAEQSFENPAFERIVLGVVLPPLAFGPVTFKSYLRGGFVDLFDYWEATNIAEPRTQWFLRGGGEAAVRTGSYARLYLNAVVDGLYLRSGRLASAYRAETGVAFQGAGFDGRTLSLFLCFIGIHNTEELEGREIAVRLIGLGFALRAAN